VKLTVLKGQLCGGKTTTTTTKDWEEEEPGGVIAEGILSICHGK